MNDFHGCDNLGLEPTSAAQPVQDEDRGALLALANRIEEAAERPIHISVEAAKLIRAALAQPSGQAAPQKAAPSDQAGINSIHNACMFRDTCRALLARYGRPAGDAKPVAWVAADTLHSPHPGCVSSLAYMSQLDKDRGREYVPLYAAPVAAQKEDDARDAARYRLLRRKVCIAGGEFHILNLDPRYIGPDAAVELDAAIDAAMQRTTAREGEQ